MLNIKAVGGAGCSDWNMDQYLLQASELYEESCLKVNSAQMPWVAVPKTVKQARQAIISKLTLDTALESGRPGVSTEIL